MTATPSTARSNRLQWLVILLLAVLAGYAVAQITGEHGHAGQELEPEGDGGSTLESDGHNDTQESTTSTTSTTPPPGSACLLLTSDEAAAALGTSVTPVEEARQCTYVADDASGRLISVAKPAGLGGSSDALGAGMEAIASAMQGESRDLQGIGDEAHGFVSSLLVEGVARKGESHVAVVVVGASGSVDEQFVSLADLLGKATARL